MPTWQLMHVPAEVSRSISASTSASAPLANIATWPKLMPSPPPGTGEVPRTEANSPMQPSASFCQVLIDVRHATRRTLP